MAHKTWQRVFSTLLLVVMAVSWVAPAQVLAAPAPAPQADPTEKIEPLVLSELSASGQTDFFVWMAEQADLSPAASLKTKAEKGQFVFETLKSTAERTQNELLAKLDEIGVKYQSFYIANKVLVFSGTAAQVMELAERKDVKRITANHQFQLPQPFINLDALNLPSAVEPNIAFVNADDVWGLGVNGAGTVMAGNDTGLSWNHPALINQYRGWNGSTADHNYNWWDATDTYPTVPNDGHGHGTHTTGTMVGDDGLGNQIGMAPGARTIHCKNMTDSGSGSDATFTECFQWDLAPWDLTGANPNPALAPDAINNSWGYSGGNAPQFKDEIAALHAAGILVEVSSGNEGPTCASLRSPADYVEVLTTGSVNHTAPFPGSLTGFSSRGPSDIDGGYFPDVMAPGENIRSSIPGGTFEGGWSGTSMAGPHVTALVGLLWDANPNLRGDIAQTMEIIATTAVPLTGQGGSNCGGDYTTGPNNDWGVGTIDALAAVQEAIARYGDSSLNGYVTEGLVNAPGDPIGGALVQVANASDTRTATTDASGYYTMTLFSGTYTVTVWAYGYEQAVVPNVFITGTIALDIPLVAAPSYLIEGVVTDATTNWPLYARITVSGYPGAPIWTDPVSGAYSIELSAGVTYTFAVEAWVDGYLPGSRDIFVSGNAVEDFALDADLIVCTAPGYSLGAYYEQDFEATNGNFTHSGVPDDWGWGTPTTTFPGGCADGINCWDTNLTGNYSNSSDETLLSPVIDLSTAPAPLTFRWWQAIHIESASYDHAYAEVSINGGAWTTMWTNPTGTITNPWAELSYDISAAAGGNVQFRFHLTSDSSVNYEGWSIDRLSIAGASSCTPGAGGLVVGNVYDANTLGVLTGALVSNDSGEATTAAATPDDANVDDAFYTLYSASGTHTFTATYPLYADGVVAVVVPSGDTVGQDILLGSGFLSADPAALAVSVELGGSAVTSFDLNNTGSGAVVFEIREKDSGFTPGRAVGGPDPFGYMFADSFEVDGPNYNWIDITATGTPIPGLTDDSFAGPFPLDFDFPFYGAVQNQFYVSSNGHIDFGAGSSSLSNQCPLPSSTTPNNIIPILWDDLLPNYTTGGVYYQNFASCPYGGGGCTVVEYLNWNHYGGAAAGTWEAILFDSGNILIQFMDSGDETGLSSTTGIEDATGTMGLTYAAVGSCNTVNSIVDASAVCFAYPDQNTDCLPPDVPWISESPISGTVPALGAQIIEVTFDASVPEVTVPGEYYADLRIMNDTPSGALIVPVTMTVTAPADVGKLDGTVTGLGYCDIDPAPVEGAVVLVEGVTDIYTATTDANGYYALWINQEQSPLILTASALDHEDGFASGVIVTGLMTTTVNFDLRWLVPCSSVMPEWFDVTVGEGYSLTEVLTIWNDGAGAADFALSEAPGMARLEAAKVYAPMTAAGGHVTDANPNYATGSVSEVKLPDVWGNGTVMPGAGRYRGGSACNEDCSQVWVFGGGAGGTGSSDVMMYDSTNDIWTTGYAPIPNAGQNWQAVFIDGKFYLPGGYNGAHNNWLQIYDPVADTWTAGANMPSATSPMAATADGKLYIFGGNPGPSANVAVYDPATNIWTAGLTPMPTARSYGRAIGSNGLIYVVGAAITSADAFEVYDPAANTWTVGPALLTGRGDVSLFVVGGYLYVSGGISDYAGWAGLTTVERYYLPDFPTGAWEAMPAAPDAFGAAAYGCASDVMWSIGGQNASGVASTTNRYQDEGLACDCIGTGTVDIPWLSEAPITGTIGADSFFDVDVTFDSMTYTVGTYTATLKVTTNDPQFPVLDVPVAMHVVEVLYGVSISPDATLTGEPGETVVYDVIVTNSGNGPVDSYDLTLGASNWTTTLDVTTVGPLAAGESATAQVSVTVPPDVVLPDDDVVLVTATSQGDATKTASANLTTVAGGNFGVDLEPEASAQSSEAGKVITYTLRLTNTGTTADTFEVSVAGATAAWASLPVSSFDLAGGEGVDVLVIVTIPADAAVGDYAITVTATSFHDPTQTDTVDITTTVIVVVEPGMKLYLPIVFKLFP